MNLTDWMTRQVQWSQRTFGAGRRTEGLLAHIASEFDEIRNDPTDVEEWVDIAILAFDGAWRAGGTPEYVAQVLADKQRKNIAREWPEPPPEDQPSFHVK